MSHKLVNFTRGSQLIGHFGFMFAAGLKAPALLAALCFGGMIWWRINHALSDQESYLCWLRLYAVGYRWFEFDTSKAIDLIAGERQLLVPVSAAIDHPLIAAAWSKCVAAARSGAISAALITGPAILAFTWIAAWFGRRSKESRHERGATLATTALLLREILAHNAQARSIEYRRLLGPGWRLARRTELRAADLYEPYSLAGVPFPWRLEQSHTMLIGTTGTGKTVALRDLLSQARARGDRAVVFDLTGAFIEAFYDPARDVILNPLDDRCPQWSVFEDCTDEAEFTAAAEALVPHDGGGSEQFWVLAARMLFVEMCLQLAAEGRATNRALSDELMTASLAHVHKLMQGTIADPLTAPEAARMAESIRAVFNANAKALRMLPDTGRTFSVRRWVDGEGSAGGFLFVSARYVDMAVSSRLLTVWMDTAMNTLMAGPRSGDLKLWFVFDELGALHRLPALEKGLQTARNYGGAIVIGVHAYAKLKETYGDNMAMTLAALARTKLVLATADRESATWCSDFIGHRQFREMEEGYSYGYNNARDAVSLTPRRLVEPLLLPDQLMNLPRLRGYLKYPDGFPAAPIRLRYVDYPGIAPAFVPRSIAPQTSPLSPTAAAADDPTGASGAADQGPGPAASCAGHGDPVAAGKVAPAQRPDDGATQARGVTMQPDLFARSATSRSSEGGAARQLSISLPAERTAFLLRPVPRGPGTEGRPEGQAGAADAAAVSETPRPGTSLAAPTTPSSDHLMVRELRDGIGADATSRDDDLDLGA